MSSLRAQRYQAGVQSKLHQVSHSTFRKLSRSGDTLCQRWSTDSWCHISDHSQDHKSNNQRHEHHNFGFADGGRRKVHDRGNAKDFWRKFDKLLKFQLNIRNFWIAEKCQHRYEVIFDAVNNATIAHWRSSTSEQQNQWQNWTSRQQLLYQSSRWLCWVRWWHSRRSTRSTVINKYSDSLKTFADFRKLFSFIISRKANKVSIRINVTPSDDLKADDEVITGFTMQFTYSNVHTSTPEKDSQSSRQALSVRVYVNAGKIAAT